MAFVVLFFAFICIAWVVRKVTGKTWGRAMLWTVAGGVVLFLLAGVGVALVDFFGIADTIK